jgi:hypothetical protein
MRITFSAALLLVLSTASPLSAVSHPKPCKKPSKLLLVSGDAQTVTTYGQPVPFAPLTVQVTICGTPIPAVAVTFSCANASGASISCGMPNGPQVRSDDSGHASLTGLTLQPDSGKVTVTATASAASLPPQQFHLTVAAAPKITVSPAIFGGTISGSGLNCDNSSGMCSAAATGLRITLTATPNNNQILFAGWSGACAGQGNPCTISLTASTNVSAEFGWLSGTYHGSCAYRCCDANNNCNVFSTLLPDCSTCTWNSICSQGNIGWSAGNAPIGPQYSTLSCTPGCWNFLQYVDGSGSGSMPCQ